MVLAGLDKTIQQWFSFIFFFLFFFHRGTRMGGSLLAYLALGDNSLILNHIIAPV